MALDRKKLIEVVKENVAKIEPQYDGYNDELLEAVTEIIYKESLHEEKAIFIQKEISEIIKKVGSLVLSKK